MYRAMTPNVTSKLLILLLVLTWICASIAFDALSTPRAQDAAADSSAQTEDADRPFDDTITIPELFDKAREAFGLDEHRLAETFYQEILIREPSNVRAMLELANVYERSGKLEYARGLLNRSARIEPGNETIKQKLDSVERVLQIVLTEEVEALVDGKHYELAIPKLSLQISIQPDNAELLYKKAYCSSELGRFDAALADLSKAIQIDPQQKYYVLRGDVLKSLKAKESRDLITQAKRLVSSGSAADLTKASRILGEVLQVDPDNEWVKAELTRLGRDSEVENTDNVEHDGELSEVGAGPGFVTATRRKAAALFGRHLGAVLLFLTILLLFRSPLTLLVVKSFFPHAVLSGSFSKFSFSEILLMLNTEFHTGVLRVKGDSRRGKIYFENGEPCHCCVGKLDGIDALVHLLNNTASGHFNFSDGSMPLKRTINIPLSIILMEHKKDPREKISTSRYSNDGRDDADGGDQQQQKSKSRMRELLDNKVSD